MAETVDSIIVSLSYQELVEAMSNEKYQPYFAAHTELQDASHIDCLDSRDALCAASVEIAKILTVFDGQIGDDWRHTLIMLGGALIKLDRDLDGKSANG